MQKYNPSLTVTMELSYADLIRLKSGIYSLITYYGAMIYDGSPLRSQSEKEYHVGEILIERLNERIKFLETETDTLL